MPNSKTHNFATGILLIWTSPIILNYFINGRLEILFFSTGLALTFYINPDLDLVENRKWSLWKIYWFPYGKLISHRSIVSHGFILSTIIRFFYLFWWTLFIDWVPINFIIWMITGMIISDSVHTIMDIVSTYFKRRF